VDFLSVPARVIAATDAADAAGPAMTDGCSPFTNAGDIPGKIVLIERGTCGFAEKAKRAKDEFVSAVTDLTDEWVEAGLITGAQKDAIQSAAAKYRL
jgi:hypothetical protein